MKKVLAVLFAVLLIAVSAVPAFAAESPSGTYSYNVDVVPSDGGSAKTDIKTDVDDKGNTITIATITVVVEDGYEFDHWTIDGAYTTDNKLTDKEITLVLSSDVTVTPSFKKIGSTDATTSATTVTTDKTSTSPKTGSSDVAVFSVILLAAAVCGVATLKLVKSK